MGTKLRALYQRRKGRDLFDLSVALGHKSADPFRVVAAFSEYMDRSGYHVTRYQFEKNLQDKLHDPQFTADIGPLLAPGFSWDIKAAIQGLHAQAKPKAYSISETETVDAAAIAIYTPLVRAAQNAAGGRSLPLLVI